jgi:hypothetical protein
MKKLFLSAVLLLAGCTSRMLTEHILLYQDFESMRYYVENDNLVVVEFWNHLDGFDVYVDFEYKTVTSSDAKLIYVSIYGNDWFPAYQKPEDPRIHRNAENHCYFNIEEANASHEKLQLYYQDSNGLRAIPYAGVLSKPFEDYVPKPMD